MWVSLVVWQLSGDGSPLHLFITIWHFNGNSGTRIGMGQVCAWGGLA